MEPGKAPPESAPPCELDEPAGPDTAGGLCRPSDHVSGRLSGCAALVWVGVCCSGGAVKRFSGSDEARHGKKAHRLPRSCRKGNSSFSTMSRQTVSGRRFFLGMTTRSSAGGNKAWCKRKNSRNTRLMRLRTTAVPTFFVTAIPSRQSSSSGAREHTNTTKCLRNKRHPAS